MRIVCVAIALSLGAPLARAAEVSVQPLAGGAQLLVAGDPFALSATASLWIAAGRVHNPAGGEGLADMTARALVARAKRDWNPKPSADGLGYLADGLQATVGPDYIRFSTEALPEHLDLALQLLASIPTSTAPLNIRSYKTGAALNLIRARRQPQLLAREAFVEATCGARRPLGKSASVKSIIHLRDADADSFAAHHLTPEGAVVALSGKVGAQAQALVERAFDDWQAHNAGAAAWARTPRQAREPGVHLVDDPAAPAVVITGGVAGPGRGSDHYRDLQLVHALWSRSGATAVHALTGGQGAEFRVKLDPSARGAYLTMEAIVPHGSAVAALGAMRETVGATTTTDLQRLESIAKVERQRLELDDADATVACAQRVPFLLSGVPPAEPGLRSGFDSDGFAQYAAELVAEERQAWILVGRASELGASLQAAGIEFTEHSALEFAMHGLARDDAEPAPLLASDKVSAADVVAGEGLLVQAIEARGGFAALEAVQTSDTELTMYRKLQDTTLPSARRRRVGYPDRFREEWAMDLGPVGGGERQLSVVQVLNGAEIWRRQLGRERRAGPMRSRVIRQKLWRDPFRVLLRYGEPSTTIHQIEPDTLAGVTTPGIELRTNVPDETWLKLYFHPQSFQIVKQVFPLEQKSRSLTVEELFTDYREQEGVYLPFKVARFENGEYAGEDHIDHVRFNVPLADSLFQRTVFE